MMMTTATAKDYGTGDGEGLRDGEFLESLWEGPTSTDQYVPRPSESGITQRCEFAGDPTYLVGYFDQINPVDETVVGRRVFEGQWQSDRSMYHMKVPQMVVDHLKAHFKFPVESQTRIRRYVEIFLKTGKRTRCHPNYRGKGHRFDWVLLREDPFRGYNRMFTGYKGVEHVSFAAIFGDSPVCEG